MRDHVRAVGLAAAIGTMTLAAPGMPSSAAQTEASGYMLMKRTRLRADEAVLCVLDPRRDAPAIAALVARGIVGTAPVPQTVATPERAAQLMDRSSTAGLFGRCDLFMGLESEVDRAFGAAYAALRAQAGAAEGQVVIVPNWYETIRLD